MTMICWLVVIVLFIAVEVNTMALTTIWFAGGAVAAFLAALAGLTIKTQLGLFVIVSLGLLIFTRPFAMKFVNKGTVNTNAMDLIGKKARVTAEINNQLSKGAAVVNGQEWTARSAEELTVIPEGEIVLIREIRCVKLIVDRIKEEK